MDRPQAAFVERAVRVGDDLPHRRAHAIFVPRRLEERLVRGRIEERQLGQTEIIASRLNRKRLTGEDRNEPRQKGAAMATVMEMKWPSISRDDYERAREAVDWEGNVPDGAIFHVSWFEDGLRVVDVWESEDAFNRFANERLMPKLQELEIGSDEPDVQFHDAHAYFDAQAVRA
jgi:hypothetical protein